MGLLLLYLVFGACDPSSYQFDYQDLKDNTVTIELIHYDNPEQNSFISWIPNHSSALAPISKLPRMSVLETLDDEKKSDFFKTTR